MRAGQHYFMARGSAMECAAHLDAMTTMVMARGSAMECAAHLDAMTAMGVVDRSGIGGGHEFLERVVAMLTKMCDV